MIKVIVATLLLSAAGYGWEDAAAYLCGAGSVEEMEEDELVRYESLHDHPLDINSAPRSRILATGLMSAFQTDQLIEYRRETGDILSLTELCYVPGFTEEYARALQPFIVFRSSRAPGQPEDLRVRQDMTVRAAVKIEDEASWSAGIKYTTELGERAALMWSTRTTYDDSAVRPGTISAVWYGKRWPGKIVAGDFAARFGQGLAQWSGFSLSGYSSTQSFRRNGSGISATSAYSSSLKGLAADWTAGRYTFSAATAVSAKDGLSLSPILNITRTSRRATIGITGTYGRSAGTVVSADFHAGLPDISIYGETALKINANAFPAAILGAIWKPVYGTSVALLGRYYDPGFKKDWSALAAGFENGWISATADVSYNIAKEQRQYKMLLKLSPELTVLGITLNPSLRANWRLRPESSPPYRMDLRADIEAKYGSWQSACRYNILWSRERAWLWFAEQGYDDGILKYFARFTLFCINRWDDRIYVYERDAPGSFNVPAYYGRGFAVSLVPSLKVHKRNMTHSLNMRLSAICYKWNPEPKPTKLELKFQYGIKF